ncbi:N-acetyl-gamma-glutamyl-phosphate reductase [Sedimentisphaera salicampi]|uniref:N-acetyl-gamma-glutamyl-phosphate reductase n=1 Tax=Sedimentisphaera salicampi TaxID=1941349 RepID=UPI000B9A872C|nr:N-acetyl-gamma-glutamyl-phosphate reductase [Sedimentisphaera salicampi]OXU14467.1 N-acetyl-gamma-glutamyl-phosphate reductase [Sedimentisphaera salicampi]
MKKVRAAVIGATGYTGRDTIEMLLSHRFAEVTYLTASSDESVPASVMHPRLTGRCGLDIEPLNFDKLADTADAALCCLPHKVSMSFVPRMLEKGLKVVDFSADYRIKDVEVYEQHYAPHTDRENISRAVYGLPELFRSELVSAELAANPGCFPTGAILGLAPLLKAQAVDPEDICVNAVSGATGAGKKPSPGLHFPNHNENIRPYKIGSHRHMPEIEQICEGVAGSGVNVLFQPHIGSFDRGIISSIYTRPSKNLSQEELKRLFEDFYQGEPFVQVLDSPPEVKNVAKTNYCHIYPAAVKGRIAVFTAIDNLVKGASGQAIQNMNIMFGIDEKEGLL